MPETTGVHTRFEGGVLYATLNNPPLNLIGPEVVRDLIDIVLDLEARPEEVRVLVLDSAVPDYFSAHVDLAQRDANFKQFGRLGPSMNYSAFYARLSRLNQVKIAKIAGRIGGAGSELALACDMRFAARETAVFTQMEVGLGLLAGAGGIQHLTRLMGRARALEVLLGANSFSADLAERYGWINRALPAAELDPFVEELALRIARFPTASIGATLRRVNEIALPALDAVREDLAIFYDLLAQPDTKARISTLLDRGLQEDSELEANIGYAVGQIPYYSVEKPAKT